MGFWMTIVVILISYLFGIFSKAYLFKALKNIGNKIYIFFTKGE
jgi:hypothetical protein